MLGLPFSFAHHFAAANTDAGARRPTAASFRPSADLDAPYVMLGVVGGRAPRPTSEAEWLAGSGALAFLRLRSGRPGRYPTPEEAAEYRFTPHEREAIKGMDVLAHRRRARRRCGRRSPTWSTRTGADELMVTTLTHGPGRTGLALVSPGRRGRRACAASAAGPTPPSAV